MTEPPKDYHPLIDACRPGSDDVQLPEMRRLAEQLDDDERLRSVYRESQRWDAAVQDAFTDVEVPDGLLDRMLAAVESEPVETGGPTLKRWPRRARWTVVTGGLLAAAASLVLIVSAFRDPAPPSLTADQLAGQAALWPDALSDDRWHRVDASQVSRFPWPRGDLHARLEGFQPIQLHGVALAGCYRITGVHRQTAYLFVLPASAARVDAVIPPTEPLASTRGRNVGVWQANERIYVLVFEGTRQGYRQMLRRTTHGVAVHARAASSRWG